MTVTLSGIFDTSDSADLALIRLRELGVDYREKQVAGFKGHTALDTGYVAAVQPSDIIGTEVLLRVNISPDQADLAAGSMISCHARQVGYTNAAD